MASQRGQSLKSAAEKHPPGLAASQENKGSSQSCLTARVSWVPFPKTPRAFQDILNSAPAAATRKGTIKPCASTEPGSKLCIGLVMTGHCPAVGDLRARHRYPRCSRHTRWQQLLKHETPPAMSSRLSLTPSSSPDPHPLPPLSQHMHPSSRGDPSCRRQGCCSPTAAHAAGVPASPCLRCPGQARPAPERSVGSKRKAHGWDVGAAALLSRPDAGHRLCGWCSKSTRRAACRCPPRTR